MTRPILAFVLLLMASADAVAEDEPKPGTPVTLSTAEKGIVEREVRKVLKDPESARFGEIAGAKDDQGMIVCGQVNAKNSFGGYTGMLTFLGTLLRPTLGGELVFSVSGIAENESVSRAYSGLCRKRGVPSF